MLSHPGEAEADAMSDEPDEFMPPPQAGLAPGPTDDAGPASMELEEPQSSVVLGGGFAEPEAGAAAGVVSGAAGAASGAMETVDDQGEAGSAPTPTAAAASAAANPSVGAGPPPPPPPPPPGGPAAAAAPSPGGRPAAPNNGEAYPACNEVGQEATLPDQIPRVVAGYDLGKRDLLGRGAFSLVFKGVKQNTGEVVAVKAVTIAPENPASFHSELKASKVVLGHPNIVALLDSSPPVGPTGFLMFELCERGEVFNMIRPSVGLVPRELIGVYFAQLVEAVVHVHSRGVCHLDIKPENLFVDASGRVKLGDFGLSTFSEDGPVVGCRGSQAYAAPENVRSFRRAGCSGHGQGYDGQKADVWSVGVVLFVLLYGMTPWEIARDSAYEYRMYKLSGGYPNIQPWVRVPTAVRTLFHHTMWSRPARRWSAEALRGYIARDLGWRPSPPAAFLQMMLQKAQAANTANSAAR